jgi:adenylate kinase family enzyme
MLDSESINRIILGPGHRMILVGGPSGSGKSTFARKLKGFIHHQVVILEADMFFYDDQGEYKFDPAKLRYAHEWCQKTAKVLYDQGLTVIVANTFCKPWESEFYRKFEMNVPLFRMMTQYKNIHGVPEEKVIAMREATVSVPNEHPVY